MESVSNAVEILIANVCIVDWIKDGWLAVAVLMSADFIAIFGAILAAMLKRMNWGERCLHHNV